MYYYWLSTGITSLQLLKFVKQLKEHSFCCLCTTVYTERFIYCQMQHVSFLQKNKQLFIQRKLFNSQMFTQLSHY